jgi:putative hydroxymethylpyrimidine transport system ATP-binding protein
MRQRAALARTLYEDRPIVLMDEPFSALDTLTRTRIQTLAATLLAGRTVVLITHDPQEACRLSHRLLVLSAADGDIDDSHHLAGTPRAPDAPDLLIGQAALLQQLMRANHDRTSLARRHGVLRADAPLGSGQPQRHSPLSFTVPDGGRRGAVG